MDNLKLGYGGTQSEMQRLVKDAAKVNSAVDANSLSFDNCVLAIHTMQEQMNISGTTSREAMSTIEGSVNATKAAWDNFLTSLGRSDADMGAATSALLEGVTAVAQNVIPRLAVIAANVLAYLPGFISTVVQTFANVVPQIGERIQEQTGQTLPQILSSIFQSIMTFLTTQAPQLIMNVLNFITQNLTTTLPGWAIQILTFVGQAIGQGLPMLAQTLITALTSLFPQFLTGLAILVPYILQGVGQAVAAVIAWLPTGLQMIYDSILFNGPMLAQSASAFFANIGTALITAMPDIVQKLIELLLQLVNYVISNAPEMLSAALLFIGAVLQGIIQSVPSILSAIGNLIIQIPALLLTLVGTLLLVGVQILTGLLNGVTQGASGLLSYVGSIPGRIKASFSGAGSWLLNAGSSIMDGLYNGLKSAWGKVTSFVGGIADWIAEHKGPISYDRRLLVPAGKAIMGGFDKALNEGFKQVKKDVSAYGVDVQSAFGDTQFAPQFATAQGQPVQSTQVVQTINFNTPAATPDVIARQMKSIYHYGLAAQYTS